MLAWETDKCCYTSFIRNFERDNVRKIHHIYNHCIASEEGSLKSLPFPLKLGSFGYRPEDT